MSRSKILNSDKEVNAFRSNLKEQRCLQKNLSILDTEAVYSLKLIDLDNRGIRVFYKRFKDKVSRIKSHLSADDLSEMHDLEAKGKMPIINKTVNISGALRIADAEKRLKIQSTENTRKARSAHPLMRQNTRSFECLTPHDRGHQRPNTTGGAVERQLSSSLNARHDTSKRNSVGVMLDIAELPKGTSRSKSSRGNKIPRPGQFSQRSLELDTANNNNAKSPKSPRSPRSPQVSGSETKPASILINSVKSIMTKIRESENCYSEQDVNDPKQNGHKKMHVRIDTESVSVFPDTSPQETDVNNKNSLAVPRTVEKRPPSTGKQLRSKNMESQDDSTVNLDKVAKSKKTNQCDDGLDIGPDRQSLSRVSNATRYSTASAGQFSCHMMQDRESAVASRLDIFSGGDDNRIGEYLGEDPYEERRQRMLSGEQERMEELLDQKDFYLERIDLHIREMEKRNRQMSIIAPTMDVPDNVLRQVRKEAGDRARASRLNKMRQGIHRSSISEEERKRRAQEMWKDVNKCRYLRVPSDRIDLSGIVTLASAQMKLLSAMRNGEEM
ncbi:uncharacterized protein LOC110458319 [Mizuhopecten yessoensis]|uniref:Uncharacterized protein n=1 Tax=Mizuhopecten yessoensis TaxID=6573 RepID=A0A210Q6U5_MIZYE|nr:uncharacterized protein LOC110458319 [Mizuhopecten yessoensis]OWF44462.1 hypothetical protein KP79_PYT15080 [Mizuhopecten yessoensis]